MKTWDRALTEGERRMMSMQILIGALSTACLLVACLIVVVLRQPVPKKTQSHNKDEAKAQTLARIYAVQMAQAAQAAPSKPVLDGPALPAGLFAGDPAPPGRIPNMPAPSFTQREDKRDRSLPAAHIPTGPLPFENVSSEHSRSDGPNSPIGNPISNGYPVSGELRPLVSPNGGAAFGSWPASGPGFVPGASGGSTLGRMPEFIPAELALGHVAHATEQRRLGALTRVYAEGIQVAYDPECDAVDVAFSACPMRSREEVELAFRVLLAKVRTVLKPLGRDRAALLMDVGGLEIGPEMMPVWGDLLKEFVVAACEQPGPGRYLIARYTSRAPSAGSQQEMITRIHNMPLAAAQSFQNSVFGSREVAAALLARLRELAAMPGN